MAANIQYFDNKLDFIPMKDNETCAFSDDQYSHSLNFLIEKRLLQPVKFIMQWIIQPVCVLNFKIT